MMDDMNTVVEMSHTETVRCVQLTKASNQRPLVSNSTYCCASVHSGTHRPVLF